MIHRAAVASIDELLANVGQIACQLVRFDVSEGVAISHLFDGDEQHPRTCQWRVIAPNRPMLQTTVEQLLVSLAARGVTTNEPCFSDISCCITDRGPW